MKPIKLALFVIFSLLSIYSIFNKKGITIFLAGDSTIAKKIIEKRPETGWGEKIGLFFSETIKFSNHARNGRSTKSFINEGKWQAIMDNTTLGDYVFIQFGHNDQSKHKIDRYTPPEDFKKNLTKFVIETRAKDAIPVLFTPVMRKRFDENEKFYDVHGKYPDLVRQVAKRLNVHLIDLHKSSGNLIIELGKEKSKELFLILKPGVHPNYPNGIDDNTHFSEYGASVIAELVANEIKESDIPLKEHLVERSIHEKADIIVAQDGTGNFTKIQNAIESIEPENKEHKIILIKNGLYNEKIVIKNSYITLVGESKDDTIIQFAELRKNWMKKYPSSFGSATVNIDSNTENITFANLTIHNNYGNLHGDHDHQFAILGLGTKVSLLNCNVIADGADTVSLWAQEDGMYYHSHCYFEGWVDYVCPRGWCYITDSKFYGHNLTASLWHKGIGDKDQKFVIRHSYFDGVPGFPLGRHHSDGQFYLLDCIFSENMADVPIFWPVSPNAKVWEWGQRHYYDNCHRLGGDYDWFVDNLSEADKSPTREQITAEWTFAGKWNPEKEMQSVLPYVFLPKPRNGSYRIDTENIELSWIPSRNAESFNVYFWKSKFPQALKNGEKLKDGPSASGKPVFSQHQKERTFIPVNLESNSTYYWRIDEIINGEIIEGPLWHFTTK